ncbi:hypothetical protein AWZ03_014333 [Drosophila navojoa]|uniref:Reverse transcriptase domain-containing protein n=1 Tax=Drosophila navojoa TaxID=7232 RepID=A0A484AS12_DRONA|nr:hypothetical protein AWZ03_014333 [Drosophila navojoa]
MTATIDTGATRSFMSEDCVRQQMVQRDAVANNAGRRVVAGRDSNNEGGRNPRGEGATLRCGDTELTMRTEEMPNENSHSEDEGPLARRASYANEPRGAMLDPAIEEAESSGGCRIAEGAGHLREEGRRAARIETGRWPFGLHSAGATFQTALDTVIGPEMAPHALTYLDDIVVIGASKEEHTANLREVFRRLRAANLKVNSKKCSLAYLGHVISGEGICTDSAKVEAIRDFPTLKNLKELRQCQGSNLH